MASASKPRDDVSIRQAGIDDIDGLAELASRSFQEAFGAQNDPADIDEYLRTTLSRDSLMHQFADARSVFLVAEIPGRDALAGYAKLRLASEHVTVHAENPIEIERIYADNTLIGRGIGAALMRACLQEAVTRDCDVIWLGVWEHNDRAIEFYKRWGFEVTGSHEFLLGSDVQNDLVMARKSMG